MIDFRNILERIQKGSPLLLAAWKRQLWASGRFVFVVFVLIFTAFGVCAIIGSIIVYIVNQMFSTEFTVLQGSAIWFLYAGIVRGGIWVLGRMIGDEIKILWEAL